MACFCDGVSVVDDDEYDVAMNANKASWTRKISPMATRLNESLIAMTAVGLEDWFDVLEFSRNKAKRCDTRGN